MQRSLRKRVGSEGSLVGMLERARTPSLTTQSPRRVQPERAVLTPVILGMQLLTGALDVAETTLQPAAALINTVHTGQLMLVSPKCLLQPAPSLRGGNALKHAAECIVDMAQVRCMCVVRADGLMSAMACPL